MDFNNLVTAAIVNNLPALINAGKTRFKGFEVATDFRLFHAVFARASSLGGRRQLSLQLRDPAGERIHDAPGGTTSDRQAKRGPRGGGPRATPPGGPALQLRRRDTETPRLREGRRAFVGGKRLLGRGARVAE